MKRHPELQNRLAKRRKVSRIKGCEYDILVRWFDLFFEKVIYAGTGKDKVALIMDNHNSHTSDEFIQTCKDNNIIPLFMPANTLHICQPLDSYCFATVKNAYREIYNKKFNNDENVTVDKASFQEAYEKARRDTLLPRVIRRSWKEVGLTGTESRERVLNGPGVINKPKQAEIEQPIVLDISKKYEFVSPVKDEDKKILEIQLNGSPRQRSIALDYIVERSREKNSIIAGLRAQVENLQAKLEQLLLSPP